jgi:rubrerythrin
MKLQPISFGITLEQDIKINNLYKQIEEESIFKVNKADIYRDLFEKGLSYYENVDLLESLINNLQKMYEVQLQEYREKEYELVQTKVALDQLNELYTSIRGKV